MSVFASWVIIGLLIVLSVQLGIIAEKITRRKK